MASSVQNGVTNHKILRFYTLFAGRYVFYVNLEAYDKVWPSLLPTLNAALNSLQTDYTAP